MRMLPLLAMVPLFQLWFGTYFIGKVAFIAYGVGVLFVAGTINATPVSISTTVRIGIRETTATTGSHETTATITPASTGTTAGAATATTIVATTTVGGPKSRSRATTAGTTVTAVDLTGPGGGRV